MDANIKYALKEHYMPLYDYECQKCHYLIEDVFQQITEKPFSKCPECDGSFERVFLRPPDGFIGCKTLGSWAEKNTKLLGNDKIEQMERERREKRKQGDAIVAERFGVQFKDKTYKQDEKLNKIARMTPEQKSYYIKTGKGL